MARFLSKSGLASSGLTGSSLNRQDTTADNLVMWYPFERDLVDQKGSAGGSTARSTTGTYLSSTTGLVATAIANNPRFEQEGLLCEAAATNYLLYTEELNEDWAGTPTWGLSTNIDEPEQDGTLGPDGTASAWKVTATTAATAYVAQTLGAVPGDVANSASVWLKAGNTTDSLVWFTDFTGALLRASSGDLTLTDDWQEFKLSGSAAGGALVVFLSNFGDTPDAGDYIYVAFPNLQDTAFPTSYIPETDGGADTRTQETTTIPDDALPAQNAAQTFCWKFTMMGDTGGNQQIWRVNGETNPRRAVVNTSESLLLYFGSNFVSSAASTVTPNVEHTAVLKTDGVNFEGFLDGTSMGTAAVTGLSGATNDISFVVGSCYCNVKDFRCYDANLTTAQLEEIGYA